MFVCKIYNDSSARPQTGERGIPTAVVTTVAATVAAFAAAGAAAVAAAAAAAAAALGSFGRLLGPLGIFWESFGSPFESFGIGSRCGCRGIFWKPFGNAAAALGPFATP